MCFPQLHLLAFAVCKSVLFGKITGDTSKAADVRRTALWALVGDASDKSAVVAVVQRKVDSNVVATRIMGIFNNFPRCLHVIAGHLLHFDISYAPTVA